VEQPGKPVDHEALSAKLFLADSVPRDWRAPDRWYCMKMLPRATEVAVLLPWGIIDKKNRITAGDFLLIAALIMANPGTFWDPVPGLQLMRGEKRNDTETDSG
jgi:hypothetical protein